MRDPRGMGLQGFDPGEVLDDDGAVTLVRGRLGVEARPALALWIASDDGEARLHEAAAVARRLGPSHAPQPLALTRAERGFVLVGDDPGGVPLSRLLAGGDGLELALFLELALQLSAALARVHAAGLLHRGVRPAQILVDVEARRATLLGLHGAAPADLGGPPAITAAALPYVAPEMTGRTGLTADYRSDYYALGATLFHMLTGQVPFADVDPMRVVHGHIARAPPDPGALRPAARGVVAAIVLRLLAKAPDERYQSSHGLRRDLLRCLRDLQTRGAIADFEPGLEDISERLRLPDLLLGREPAIAALTGLFDRAAAGEVVHAVISGPAGIGKSALAEALARELAGRARVARGACTRFHRSAPFSVLAAALQDLFGQVLADRGPALPYWRELLQAAVGAEGRLVADVIPSLGPLLGPLPPVPALPPVESANRFRHLLRRLVAALARPQHPLALIIDDLQWCDPATLALLVDLHGAADVGHLLVIATQREDEAGDEADPAASFEALRGAGGLVHRERLGPLSRAQVGEWIAAALHPCTQDLGPLVDMVAGSTGGNPFLVRLLIHSLHEQRILCFDPEQGVWEWRAERVAAATIPEDIGALVSERIAQLSPAARGALTTAAGVGPRFDLGLVASLLGATIEAAAAALREAELRGLVVAVQDAEGGGARRTFHFFHQRVHQAALAALAPERAAALHLAIGRALARSSAGRGDGDFEVVSHLNLGAALIDDPEERRALARRNLAVARRALAATGYAAAAEHARRGLALVGEATPGDRVLGLALGQALVEAEYMGGDPDAGDALFHGLLAGASDDLERAALIDLKIGLDIFHGRHEQAIEGGVDGLARLGVELAADPDEAALAAALGRVEALVGGRSVAALAALPDADDPRTIVAMQILMDLGPAAMFTRGRLAFAIFLALVELSLTRGITRASSYGFAGCGMALACSLGRHADGGDLGEVALRLVDRCGDASLAARTYQLVGGLLLPWTRPFAPCIELLDRGYRLGIATGDLASACYNATSVLLLEIARGRSLYEVRRAAEAMLRESGRIFAVHGSSVLRMSLRLQACLAGERPEPTPASAERWLAEVWDEPDPQATALSLLYDNLYATLVLLIFGCPAAARPLPPRAAERLRAFATPMSVDALYLHALCRCRTAAGALAPEDRADVESTLARLATWAAACPENFAARHALLRGELARVDGRRGDAEAAYKEAILAARRSGEAQSEALACELAGRLCAAHEDPVLSDMYLRTSMEAYGRWGASAKAAALARELGLGPGRAAEAEHAPAPLTEGLDLASLIKASRAISSEIQLDRVLRTLLEVVMENAGAARGLVVLEAAGRLEVVAEGSVDPPAIRVHAATPLAEHPAIARSVVEHVCRGRRDVLLARADREGEFRGDPYLAGARVKSVVCTPILHQGRCTGALYLEHARAEGVFTAARLELLRQLAAQLAVSIENARLYDDLSRARSEAIAAERVKARFLMNMSHELRTPLNAVIGYAELMQENLAVGAIDTFADDLDRIHRAARNLLRTLSGILELSKLAGGVSFVERAAVDLDALLAEVVGEHQESAAAAGNLLEVTGEPLGQVSTDRSMVRYCVHCLIDNACKFTQRGRITVDRARERGGVVIQVRDTGIGIPASALQTIFGAFTQVNDSAARAHEGAGVGLAVARHFARLIGGDLTVQSALGQGSTFALTIPASPAS